jgi:hypothetical protein
VGTARMRILNVAYPLLPVSAGSAGGAEQILYLLDHGLRKRGIESVVIAAKGSKVSGTLWPTPAASKDVTDRERSEAQEIHRRTIAKVLESERVDLIHFHGLDFSTYLPETHIPKLATLHLPITWYEPGSLNKPDVSLVSVSESQARAGAIDGLCQVVQNGIDVSKHSPGDAARSSLLWLGRICLEKGTSGIFPDKGSTASRPQTNLCGTSGSGRQDKVAGQCSGVARSKPGAGNEFAGCNGGREFRDTCHRLSFRSAARSSATRAHRLHCG